jgi:hypothetical protein
VVTIFTTIYNDYFRKPYIKTTDIARSNNTYYNISLANIGLQLANSTRITITSPLPILHPISFFSTEDIILTKNESKSVAFYLPRFAQGYGSLISVTMGLIINLTTCNSYGQCDDLKDKFVVYSTYDQGSNTLNEEPDPIREFLSQINTKSNFITGILAAASIVYIILIIFMLLRFRRKKERAFIFKTREHILYIRDKLKSERVCTETFTILPPILDIGDIFNFYKRYKLYTQMRQFRWDKEFFSKVKLRTFTKIEDIDLIDEYNGRLKERDNYIINLLKLKAKEDLKNLLKLKFWLFLKKILKQDIITCFL